MNVFDEQRYVMHNQNTTSGFIIIYLYKKLLDNVCSYKFDANTHPISLLIVQICLNLHASMKFI